MYAIYRKAPVSVKVTILLGTMIRKENNALNLFMVDVLVTITNSKLVTSVNIFVFFLTLWVLKILIEPS